MYTQQYLFINLFRAVAAFWVLTAHCVIWGQGNSYVIPNPKIAVDLFMIISGFLMMANITAREKAEPFSKKINWIKFWLRRYFRIAPAYYLSLLFAVVTSKYYLHGFKVLQTVNPDKWINYEIYNPYRITYTIKNIILHITFLFGLHPQYSFSTFLPDWSLSLEMQFYILFPFLFILMKSSSQLKIATIIGLSSGIFFTIYSLALKIKILPLSFNYYEPSLLLFKLNYFIIGILIFEILSFGKEWHKARLYIILTFVLSILELRYRFEILLLPVLVAFMLYFVFVHNEVLKKNNIISALLESKLVNYLSDFSYSIYLFHGFFISFCGLTLFSSKRFLLLPTLQKVAIMWSIVLVSSCLLGYVVFRFIELPGINIGRKIVKKIA